MKERHIIGYTLLGAVLVFLAIFLFTRDISIPKNQAMPWQSYVNDRQQTVVFNLTMGESRLIDAARHFGTEIKASLFESENSKPELEVYFPSTKIGGISAKIILNLLVNDATMMALKSNIEEVMIMPSGVKTTTFTAKGERLISNLKIKSLSFVPRANLEEQVISNLFGKPASVDLVSDKLAYWHYPQKGLRIIVSTEQKEILEFYNQ
jgi:hypothetical protein